jgi:coenzyme PQQ synthesis protein D (PqqD)
MKGAVVLPRARVDGLVVRQLDDETLVYDRERDKAHCLNHTAALVWKHCDGKSTAEQTAAFLQQQLSHQVDVDFVWLAIKQLQSFHLLDNDGGLKAALPSVSRRSLLVRYAPAALALPLIISIVAPVAAQNGSCANPGESCASIPCCDAICSPSFLCL